MAWIDMTGSHPEVHDPGGIVFGFTTDRGTLLAYEADASQVDRGRLPPASDGALMPEVECSDGEVGTIIGQQRAVATAGLVRQF